MASGWTLMPKRADACSTAWRAAARSRRAPRVRPRMRFSVTLMGCTSEKCWVTMPTPAAMASRGEPMLTGRPSTWMLPPSMRVSP